jgi:hypothetical protein
LIYRSKRVTNEPVPNTQISSRTDIYEQVVVDEDAVKEDAQRMDALMRQMLGGDDEEEEDETEDTEGNYFFQKKNHVPKN